jgi:hypothetical protein
MSGLTVGALGTLQGIAVAVIAIAGLFLGFCLLFTLVKVRASGRQSGTVRGLEEVVGGRQAFFPADVPRGPIDQLRTPELLEAQARRPV